MEVRAISRRPSATEIVPAHGSLSYALNFEFTAASASGIKSISLCRDSLFTSSRQGVTRWDRTTGRNDVFVASSSFPSVVTTLCISEGTDIWCGTGDGSLLVFDVETGSQKLKAWSGHSGEVNSLAALPTSHGGAMVTAGADFQVKVWSPDGRQLGSSGHHHCAVHALLVTRGGKGVATVWSGGSDAALWCWVDAKGSGRIEEREVEALHAPGMPGVSALVEVGAAIWAGSPDGSISVWDAASRRRLHCLRHHSAKVSCLALVGSQVWSGSGDRSINAYAANTGQLLYSVAEQGGLG